MVVKTHLVVAVALFSCGSGLLCISGCAQEVEVLRSDFPSSVGVSGDAEQRSRIWTSCEEIENPGSEVREGELCQGEFSCGLKVEDPTEEDIVACVEGIASCRAEAEGADPEQAEEILAICQANEEICIAMRSGSGCCADSIVCAPENGRLFFSRDCTVACQ